MASIRVTPEELESQAQQLVNGSGEVQAIIAKLMGQVNALAGQWDGQGRVAFEQLFQEWQKGANMTKEGMEGLSTFLNQAATAYRDTDSAIGSASQ